MVFVEWPNYSYTSENDWGLGLVVSPQGLGAVLGRLGFPEPPTNEHFPCKTHIVCMDVYIFSAMCVAV